MSDDVRSELSNALDDFQVASEIGCEMGYGEEHAAARARIESLFDRLQQERDELCEALRFGAGTYLDAEGLTVFECCRSQWDEGHTKDCDWVAARLRATALQQHPKCDRCSGTGFVDANYMSMGNLPAQEGEHCPQCHGTGQQHPTVPTDEVLVEALEWLVTCKLATEHIHEAAESGEGIHNASLIEPLCGETELTYQAAWQRARTLYAAAEAHGWDRAHEPAKCGHARANYKDPKYGTSKYAGEEECEFCAALAAASTSPPPGCYSREVVLRLLERAIESGMEELEPADTHMQDVRNWKHGASAMLDRHDAEQEEGKP